MNVGYGLFYCFPNHAKLSLSLLPKKNYLLRID
jgi:hypothetical protein